MVVFMVDFNNEHKYAPSIREIDEGVSEGRHGKSTSQVRNLYLKLERMQLIRRTPKIGRGIFFLPAAIELAEKIKDELKNA